MLLQARGVWYRVLSRKLPTAVFLAGVKSVPTDQFRLCLDQVDSLAHFLVLRPNKQTVWTAIF
jgi:hypothetical protein